MEAGTFPTVVPVRIEKLFCGRGGLENQYILSAVKLYSGCNQWKCGI